MSYEIYYVYIMSNWTGSVIYIGVTNNLKRRVYEHKNKISEGFTSRYCLDKLVYYEKTSDVKSAIAREKQLKGWLREKKNQLITAMNPPWRDLSNDF